MYKPEYSQVIAFLEYKVINHEATEREEKRYNELVYGGDMSKRELAKLTRKMNKELVS